MAEEPDEPRRNLGAALVELEREDLDFYGVADLSDRIDRLTAEIERTEKKRAAKQSGKSAADALFKF